MISFQFWFCHPRRVISAPIWYTYSSFEQWVWTSGSGLYSLRKYHQTILNMIFLPRVIHENSLRVFRYPHETPIHTYFVACQQKREFYYCIFGLVCFRICNLTLRLVYTSKSFVLLLDYQFFLDYRRTLAAYHEFRLGVNSLHLFTKINWIIWFTS